MFSHGGFCRFWRRPTLTPFTAIPSALAGLTALFGMGRGDHRRYRHQKIMMTYSGRKQDGSFGEGNGSSAMKAMGLLVPLGFGVATFRPAAYRPCHLQGPSYGTLISWPVSPLDAFSAYPNPT